MDLPDFSRFPPFVALRRKMGVATDAIANFSIQTNPSIGAIFEQLRTGVVKIDSLAEVTPHTDSTLLYKGQRIILYIMDISGGYRAPNTNRYSRRTAITKADNLRKFHIADCRTLQGMREKGRKERYVVSQKTDGWFKIVRSSGESKERLLVCKNCLTELNYGGYDDHRDWKNDHKDWKRRKEIFENFSLEEFFQQYPQSPLDSAPKPQYTSANAPTGYSADWDQVSQHYRASKNWQCEACGKDMSDQRANLHVHHRNHVKHDNRRENLQALCVKCHAQQPGHRHMQASR